MINILTKQVPVFGVSVEVGGMVVLEEIDEYGVPSRYVSPEEQSKHELNLIHVLNIISCNSFNNFKIGSTLTRYPIYIN
jgi:hypothetical protein